MRQINNYKKIRVKPYLYGFTFKSLNYVIGITIVLTLLLFGNMEMSSTRIGLWVILQLINILVNRYILGDANILEKLGQKKLPDELTDLTKK